MAKRGRKPTPTNVLNLRGSWRGKARKNEVKPDPDTPICPRWLSSEARREWRRIVPELKAVALVTRLDAVALALYCEAVARYIRAEATLREEGETTTTAAGGLKLHPLVPVRDAAVTQILKTCSLFGLSPSDRVGLPSSPPAMPERDPLREFLENAQA